MSLSTRLLGGAQPQPAARRWARALEMAMPPPEPEAQNGLALIGAAARAISAPGLKAVRR